MVRFASKSDSRRGRRVKRSVARPIVGMGVTRRADTSGIRQG